MDEQTNKLLIGKKGLVLVYHCWFSFSLKLESYLFKNNEINSENVFEIICEKTAN